MYTGVELPKDCSMTLRALILLVEDDVSVRTMTALILRRLGYRVQEASSGEEALALARVNREKIDLLMTDVFLPGMSGRELAAVLQSRDVGLKVLFLSGYLFDSHGVLQPETAFLQKPFTNDAVSKKVREILDRC
jgi:two-component system cell cycle sensor histidine kinase/response regulator CckA